MKIKPNKPTEKQFEVIHNLREQNYAVHICYGADEAITVITEYLRGKRWNQQDLLDWIAEKHCKNNEKTGVETNV